MFSGMVPSGRVASKGKIAGPYWRVEVEKEAGGVINAGPLCRPSRCQIRVERQPAAYLNSRILIPRNQAGELWWVSAM